MDPSNMSSWFDGPAGAVSGMCGTQVQMVDSREESGLSLSPDWEISEESQETSTISLVFKTPLSHLPPFRFRASSSSNWEESKWRRGGTEEESKLIDFFFDRFLILSREESVRRRLNYLFHFHSASPDLQTTPLLATPLAGAQVAVPPLRPPPSSAPDRPPLRNSCIRAAVVLLGREMETLEAPSSERRGTRGEGVMRKCV
ncbi:hypothetical protein FCM35_KLT03947 [Carex littledalei]|uniref:Uncharacterized protein n=1 Tax=Carex littledalei TaxID=544730 RepID=A0A833R6V7_9POAL|nr:hypothetical protein FCM35_KLT03947 [Carex littledalei]